MDLIYNNLMKLMNFIHVLGSLLSIDSIWHNMIVTPSLLLVFHFWYVNVICLALFFVISPLYSDFISKFLGTCNLAFDNVSIVEIMLVSLLIF